MRVRRRFVLGSSVALLGSVVAGCSGTRGTETQTTPTTTNDTTITQTTPACTPVETGFEVPNPSRPTELTAETVETPTARIEKAYEDTLTVTPELLPDVPQGAELEQYALRRATIETVAEKIFQLKFIGIARYTVYERDGEYVTTTTSDGNESDGTTQKLTVVHHDAPVHVATYRVTSESISRESGIGDLTGVLHCW